MNIEKAKADLQMVGSRIISLDMKNMFVFIANTDDTLNTPNKEANFITLKMCLNLVNIRAYDTLIHCFLISLYFSIVGIRFNSHKS